MQTVAVYPGTFDPVTFGHLDIITRGTRLFDRLIVGVAVNLEKKRLFSLEQRLEFLQESVSHLPGVEVCRLEGLLVDFADRVGATAVLRGLRAVSDFEYEFQMAAMNRKLNAQMETIFLMSSESTTFISSRLVKEIAMMGGDVGPFVPIGVAAALTAKSQHFKEEQLL
ncbi:MAG: pantetheine-phosphate adenylyltransferase [Magnetococcus sp. DMHC-6]